MNYILNIIVMDDFEIDIIQENMFNNQLVKVYIELEKCKTEINRLNKMIKYYKHESLFYKRYYDAICCLILKRGDLCEFMKFVRRVFQHHDDGTIS